MNRLVPSAALVLLLAACVPPPTATAPAPVPAPAPAPAPIPTQTSAPLVVEMPLPIPENWADVPRTAGDWTYRQDAERSGAMFSTPAGEPLMAVGCSVANRQVTLIRFSRDLPQRPLQMEVFTETATRAAPATRATDGTSAGLVLPANDPLLDAIAFSRGHFAVGVTGAAPIYPPSYPEITRVIEDCR